MDQLIRESLKHSIAAKEALVATQMAAIKQLAQAMIDTIKRGNKLMIFGNGGSAADAQHMAAEFVNRFMIDRPPLAAIALTTDSSILTSVGNDFSFDDIFVKQIQALGKEGDLALGISTSGNSPNVIKAVEVAKGLGICSATPITEDHQLVAPFNGIDHPSGQLFDGAPLGGDQRLFCGDGVFQAVVNKMIHGFL